VVLGAEYGYADRSFGNLPEIQTIVAGELNAYDVLVNDWVLFTDETLPGGSGAGVEAPATAESGAAPAAKAAPATETAPATKAKADVTTGADADSAPAADDATDGDEEGSGS
jgi:hypothetical protein